MLGRQSIYAEEAHAGGFIGADFGLDLDLTNKLPENWRDFNKEFIPVWLKNNPGKTKVAAGLACGMLWTISKGLNKGDIVFCPDGKGSYFVGEISGDYEFRKSEILPHRRNVTWYPRLVSKEELSEPFLNSAGSIGTVSNLVRHVEEIERMLSGERPATIMSTDETVEDPSVFALEKHLEDFLVQNWSSTELGKKYDIFEVDGEKVGQQYPSDTGPIDILAIRKDKKELLVVELKKGRMSDVVVGQVQRYMGYVKDELLENDQTVRGVIIGFDDDIKVRRAISVTNNIDVYTYEVKFKLFRK